MYAPALKSLRALLVTLPLVALPALAEEEEGAAAGEAKVEAKAEWEEYRHFMTGFGGATIAGVEGEAGGHEAAAATATFGFDYSYRVSKLFGVGVFFDYAVGFQELLVGPCLFFFPWKGLFFEISPSLEVEKNEELFLAGRLAAGYEFELTPQFLVGLYAAVDYGHSRFAFVPGITIGYGF